MLSINLLSVLGSQECPRSVLRSFNPCWSVHSKEQCRSRNSISEAERLMVTLRYLATGDSQQSYSFLFRIGKSTLLNLFRETCKAIWLALQEQYMNMPSTTSHWLRIAKEFKDEWNIPNCIGAIDGKHIMMDCPKNGGSAYCNYTGFHSIVLLAICDPKYSFTFADIGGFGSTNDASVLSNSVFGQAIRTTYHGVKPSEPFHPWRRRSGLCHC